MSTVPQGSWIGTPSQIEWAERIKLLVSAEFNRVSEALAAVARRQSTQDRMDTLASIAILEEKREEVLTRNEAGYFIKNWQELTDQVQRLVRDDPRFAVIAQGRAARKNTTTRQAEVSLESTAV
jgi:hypothetical protein